MSTAEGQPLRILEGVITTHNEDGSPNISPMGPLVEPDWGRFILRPYQTSTTYANLRRNGQAVFHVTDDVELIARTAVGQMATPPALRPAAEVAGSILVDACRWYELQVVSLDDTRPRTEIVAEVVAHGTAREFFGLNRAMAAVVEAAILATRVQLLPAEEINASMDRLVAPVEKTGGPAERRAFAFLQAYIRAAL